MVFSSLTFLLVFMPAVLLLYFIVPVWWVRNTVLLLASLVFYAWGEPVYILLMLYSILLNYCCGRLMGKHRRHKKQILVFGIIMNLFILGFFKYQGFLTETLNRPLSLLGISIPVRELALPIGISFYTFQALSYLIDLYRGRFKAQKNLLNFALYISMFPQLIAGPIVRYEDVAKQLARRKVSLRRFGYGASFFIDGLAMKVLLANTAGGLVERIAAVDAPLSAASAWIRALAYSFQIYFDFAGYSAMAIGLGAMLGFSFPKNFDYPYLSASITEFWRRWHISLGTWFREYVYIPLGGNRVSIPRHILNILIVWALTGLWHGAAWNFVVWGLYYGILLLYEKYIASRLPIPKAIGWLFTTIAVVIGWVFFSAGSIGEAAAVIRAMFGGNGILFDPAARSFLLTGWRMLLLCAVCSTPVIKRIRNVMIKAGAGRIAAVIVYVLLLAASIAFLVVQNYNPFLYFRF